MAGSEIGIMYMYLILIFISSLIGIHGSNVYRLGGGEDDDTLHADDAIVFVNSIKSLVTEESNITWELPSICYSIDGNLTSSKIYFSCAYHGLYDAFLNYGINNRVKVSEC